MATDAKAAELTTRTRRGLQLLTAAARSPASVQEGAALVFSAAQDGHPQACRAAAVLAVLGVTAPPDWAAGLALLQRAADAGDESAGRQLVLLAGLGASSSSAVSPDARLPFDIAAWRSPPPSRALVRSPPLRVIEGFAPPDVCDWICASAEAHLAPSEVFDPETGAPIQADARSNSALQVKLDQLDLILLAVRERIGSAIRLPLYVMEPMQVLRYETGQAFAPHFDFLDTAAPGLAGDVRQRGQRQATFLVYLNDDYVFGETEFPELGVRFRGRKGDALFWANPPPDPHPQGRTLHAGLPPTAGVKWVLSQWLRERPQG